MRNKAKTLFKDPFIVMIAFVVLVPAGLVAFGISRQGQSQSAVQNVVNEASEQDDASPSPSSNTRAATPQPITQAEQPAVVAEKQSTPVAAQPAVCDQAKKQDAEANRISLISKENTKHDSLVARAIIPGLSRRYLEEEAARHQAALVVIEDAYRAAVVAANC